MYAELECSIQEYSWGKVGANSFVAKLAQSADQNFIINENKTYAELWMGTHPNGCSKLKTTNENLKEWIEANPNCLGDAIIQKFSIQLPFLFKILSVNQALSIQAHPDKKLAEELFAKSPNLYKDPNHKPELAIALTQFEGLCGFRPISQIKEFIKEIPELKNVIGEELAEKLLQSTDENYTNILRECFHALMTCPEKKVESELNFFLDRTKLLTDVCSRSKINVSTLHELAEKYPGDVGCFVLYFLNYVTLNPGEAMFLGPNVPHAYLKGDCVECMACSDNVVRAGLTPKFKDVETLCSMLEYDSMPLTSIKMQPIMEDECTILFKPPVPDFAVAEIKIPKSHGTYTLRKRSTASIIIIISGTGEDTIDKIKLYPGKVLFLGANSVIHIANETDLLIYQALANV
ncbi:mannose-6-phosphate isomerase [Chrysoperla carnea]|uniref:mannose-6-phosphate isomerase n=1 Tax=Chrysoperla carnea TaxID=189513 RepID=UPI001D073E2A|nr:mannose-6-phosphate isomerase [Chrysoperla carnea]